MPKMLTEETATYGVYVPQDELGGTYDDPAPKCLHHSLAKAVVCARHWGWRKTTDGAAREPVATIIRLRDGAQLHPWAPNRQRDWQIA